MPASSKYKILLPVLLVGIGAVHAQSGASPQAVLSIVGDPIQSNVGNTNEFGNDYNPYQDNNNAPPPLQSAQLNQSSSDPSFDSGFHVRFNLESAQNTDTSGSGYMSAGSSSSGSGTRSRKHVTMAERSFNMKKKIKTWLPKRKKRYRPHLCGRF
jgi:hypothetical protein